LDNEYYFARGSSCEVLRWVRLCVCLSVRISPEPQARSLPNFVHVAYGRDLVLLRRGDEIARGKGNFGGFLPHWKCIVQHSIWHPYKNGWTDRDGILDNELAWPEEQCITWEWRSPKKRQFCGKHVWRTSLVPLIIANWTGPCSGTRQGRRLIASVGRVYFYCYQLILSRFPDLVLSH